MTFLINPYRTSPPVVAAKWDSSVKNASVVLSANDMTATGPAAGGAFHMAVRGTIGKSSGKWQYECGPTFAGLDHYCFVGLSLAGLSTGNGDHLGIDANSIGWFNNNGFAYEFGGGTLDLGDTYDNGDRIGVLANLDDWELIFWKDGAQVGDTLVLPAGETYYPACSVYGGGALNRQGITAIFVDNDVNGSSMDYPAPGYSGWTT